MVITSVRKKGNSIFLFFEDGSNIKVNYEAYIASGLTIGNEAAPDIIARLQQYTELYETKLAAFRILSVRSHSKFELKRKLIQREFSPNVINEVFQEFERFGYLDDRHFAMVFAEEKLRKRQGSNKIRNQLLAKGVDRETIDFVLREISSETQEESALYLAEKKLKSMAVKESDSFKIKAKIYSFLQNRGFSGDIISSVIEKLNLS